MQDVLKEIRACEAKAKKIVEDAENRRKEIISRANHESLKLLNERKEQIDKSRDIAVEKKAEGLEAVRQEILEKGKAEAGKIEEKALKNMKRAEEFVLKKFEEELK